MIILIIGELCIRLKNSLIFSSLLILPQCDSTGYSILIHKHTRAVREIISHFLVSKRREKRYKCKRRAYMTTAVAAEKIPAADGYSGAVQGGYLLPR
jgi:hypothetical protein